MALETEYTSDNLTQVVTVKAQADGAPTDADFNGTPPDGALVLAHNGTKFSLYGRVDGSWVELSPAT